MTTTISGKSASEHAVIREIFHSLAEKEMKGSNVEATFQAVPKEKTYSGTGWLEFVAEEIASLPWYETNLPDGRTPPQPKAAVGLICLLAATLEIDTIAPSSVNTTWAGGVAVEWHIGGVDLEIACQPNGAAEFSFERTARERNTRDLSQATRRKSDNSLGNCRQADKGQSRQWPPHPYMNR